MVLGLICWCVSPVFGQQAIVDSLQKRYEKIAAVQQDSVAKKPVQTLDSLKKTSRVNYKIIPKKATLYSLIPGGGQIYNRQYWKAPFVWAAFGAVVYFIHDNNARYKDFLGPYIGSFDPSTGKPIRQTASVYVKAQNISRDLTLQQITQGKDFYRRYRDLNWFMLAGVFALAAVEANVSAHLKDYNEFMGNDNLSLRIEPDAYSNNLTGSVVGVKIVVGLK
jgi:Family of unknown function (DUF5683)